MTIISVDEMWSRQTGGDKSQDGKSFSSEYGAAYQISHSIDATIDEIKYAPGIYLRSSHPLNRFVYCTDVGMPTRLGPLLSIVEIKWFGESIPGVNEDPTNQEPVIRYYSTTSTEPVDTDGNGMPFTNSVGDLVEGLQSRTNDMVLDVERNFLSVSAKQGLKYLNATNSDPMQVFSDVWEPGTAALQAFNISPVMKDGQPEYFRVAATIIFRQAYNTVPARAWWHRYRNEGLNEYAISVDFSGGGGSGASAYAVAPVGIITAIVVTSGGSGYTSAPTVAITGGGGGGAGATAIVANGAVTSVSVGSGGTGYKARLIPCLDGNKERVTKPVLLKATGQQERNANAAVFIERPDRSYSLPYSALGLV